MANIPFESNYIYDGELQTAIIDLKNDAIINKRYKGRLIRHYDDWWGVERRCLETPNSEWESGLVGTAAFLDLTEQEKQWSIDKRRNIANK